MKKLIIIWLGLMLPVFMLAQQTVSFTATLFGVDTVSLFQTIEIQYKIEGTEYQDFQLPEFEGFRLVSGPYQSTSVSYINGAMSRETSYKFYLQAEVEGSYNFAPATISVNGELMESNTLKVAVTDDGIERPRSKEAKPKEQPNQRVPFPQMRKKKPVYSI